MKEKARPSGDPTHLKIAGMLGKDVVDFRTDTSGPDIHSLAVVKQKKKAGGGFAVFDITDARGPVKVGEAPIKKEAKGIFKSGSTVEK